MVGEHHGPVVGHLGIDRGERHLAPVQSAARYEVLRAASKCVTYNIKSNSNKKM